jgi:hypothetical protein
MAERVTPTLSTGELARRYDETTGFDAPSTFSTEQPGFDPVGEHGVPLSASWANGAWTLHDIVTHGFPNVCMNGHVQGGRHSAVEYEDTLASWREAGTTGLRRTPVEG